MTFDPTLQPLVDSGTAVVNGAPAVQAVIDNLNSQLTAANAKNTALAQQNATLQAQVAADAAEEAAENPPPPPPYVPAIPGKMTQLFQVGKARATLHRQMWFGHGHPLDTSDPTRNPGYDQSNPVDVAAIIARDKACGFQVEEPNLYPLGSFETAKALPVLLSECKNQGMTVLPNMDGAIYSALSTEQAVQLAIQYWIDNVFTKVILPTGVAEVRAKTGNFILSSFVKGKNATPRVWAALAKANPKIEFLTQTPNGVGQYYWGMFASNTSRDAWCKANCTPSDGLLRRPSVNANFNDLNSKTGIGVWGDTPARILPGGGNQHLLDAIAILNKYWGPLVGTDQELEYWECVGSDYDEGNHLETNPKTGVVYFLPL